MKTLNLIFIFSLLTIISIAQSPNMFKYQAVIRDASGEVMNNENITITISIIEGTVDGNIAYSESHSVTTNQFGLVNFNIGNGENKVSELSLVEWSTDNYFLRIEHDGEVLGTTQILSVPYSLHSHTADSITGEIAETDPIYRSSVASNITEVDTIKWNSKLDIEVDGSVTNEIQLLSVSNDTIYLSDGNYVKLPPAFSGTNTDEQQLSISNDTIYLSNGGAVKLPRTEHFVGELLGGGIVFWVDQTGEHGLIASLDDIDGGNGVQWSNVTSTEVGTNAQTYYDGVLNTIAIVGQAGNTSGAAKICEDYTFNGYTDWFLPAIWELNELYNNAIIINKILENDGDATTNGIVVSTSSSPYGYYWSSTEYDYNNSYSITFGTGTTHIPSKVDKGRVRAVRAF